MKLSVLVLSIVATTVLSAQQVNIIPQPAEMKIGKGNFSISPSTMLVVKNGVDNNTADFFNDYLKQCFGFNLKKVKSAVSNYIQFTTLQTLVPGKEGAYSLTVAPKGVTIQGQTASGTFCGMQTLIQLLPATRNNSKLSIPQLSINDYPRFSYRGMHLDVSRHFFPVSFIKKYIDYLALHKFNKFHWHLTDDQGWRIEIKKYPKLTSVGAWRNGTIIGRYPGKGNDGKRYGGYYTQEEIKAVVKYAADRFIDVIPEIEMPGHSSAAIAAYPELSCFPEEPTIKYFPEKCTWSGDKNGKQVEQTWGVFDDVFCAGKENTFRFLQDVLDEVTALFPSKYLHVGGDECPKENWKRCPLCQKRIKEEGLKDEHQLQSYFIQRMEKYLNDKGKTLIGWDEILEGGLAPKAVVMSWRGEQGGIDAAKQKHDVIMTPGNPVYFDHTQSKNEDSVTIGGYNPIEKVYAYEPLPKELDAEEAKYVLGAQANLWTEYITNARKAEYMIFPRMAALSEILWSPKENKNWNDFEKRLPTQFKRYDLWKANYSRAYFDLKATVLPTEDYNGLLWQIENRSKEPITINYNRGDSIWAYTEAQLINRNTVAYAYNDKRRVVQTFSFNKATGKKITLTTPASSKYPGEGAFTLVNGVQNETGLAKADEFLGFEGTDCEATIDLGKETELKEVIAHVLEQKPSWVYMPSDMLVFVSKEGKEFKELEIDKSSLTATFDKMTGYIKVNLQNIKSRYIKLLIKNYGMIEEGNPGAGNKAWLFVDEIEVN